MSDLPSRLGKYDIVRALGEGAMGTVYEAIDSVIERTVAIKTIRRRAWMQRKRPNIRAAS